MAGTKYQDDEGLDALQAIKKCVEWAQTGNKKLICVISHPQWVSRGYVFVTQDNDKYFIATNTNDLQLALAKLYMAGNEDVSDYTYGFPISEHPVDANLALKGIYVWTLQLR